MTLSVPRGKDSTGILGVEFKDTGDLFCIEKDAVRVENFFQQKGAASLVLDTNNILLGHVRHATIGKVEKDTAHPYDTGNIIGFHNGTIRNYKTAEDLTDSHRFYKKVEADGFKSALEDLPQDAAYAFVFYDKSNGLVHLFRNKRRDLYLCLSKDSKTLIYASEKRFIEAALHYAELRDKFGDPYELLTNTLLHVGKGGKKENKLSFRVSGDYLEKAVIEKHEKNYQSVIHSNYDTSGYQAPYSRWTTPRVVRDSTNSGGPSIPDVPSGLPRRHEGKTVYPHTVYEFNPCYNKIQRTIWRSSVQYVSTYFYQNNANYRNEYDLAKKFMIVGSGGAYVEIDESTYDFIVTIPGKKKLRTKRISAGDERWDGWWNCMMWLGERWEEECSRHALDSHSDFVVPASLIMTYNDLHSYAARNAGPSAREQARREIMRNRPAEDDEIPFDVEEDPNLTSAILQAFQDEVSDESKDMVYIGFGGEELNMAEAAHRLGNNCCNCFETSTMNDTVYWISRKEYVCEPCTSLNIVQSHLNLNTSTRGHLKSDVFKRMVH